jgi:peptidoglycan/LPS O-acetylase OafA/YrhL
VAAVDLTTTLDVRHEPVVIDLRRKKRAAPRSRRGRAHIAYQPALDGIRGLAVLGVLLFHQGFSWMVGGYLGVSTFFTLSGFLITTLLLTERESTGTISLPAFWARRFRRLMPASLLCLAGIVLYGLLLADGDQLAELPGDVLAALAYVANWHFIFEDRSYVDLFAAPSPVQHFWSLAIEEQYYVLFPLLTAGLLAFGRGSRRMLFVGLGALAMVSTLLMIGLYTPGEDTARVYYGTDTRAVELLAGALLAVVLAGRPELLARIPRRVVTLAGAAALGLTLIWWINVEQTSPWLFGGGLTVYALVTVVILVAALVVGPVQRGLATEPLRQLGRISYGVYLYHWPVYLWLSPERAGVDGWPLFLLRLGVTLAISVLSFRFVEQPVRTRRKLIGDRRWLAAPVAVTGIAAGVLLLGAAGPDRDDGVGRFLEEAPEAQDPEEVLAAAPGNVDTGTVPIVDRVLLVGDSVMGQAYEAFRGEFEEQGILTGYAGGPGTGPLQPQGDWARQIDRWVEEFDPDVVVMEACCDYTRPTSQVYVDPDGDAVLPNSDEVYRFWELEVLELIERARAGGAEVLFVLSPPVQTNGFYGPLEEHVTRLNELYRDLPVPLLDWGPVVAPGGEYTWEVEGPDGRPEVVRAEDGVHMTPFGNRLLAELTLREIQEIGEHAVF